MAITKILCMSEGKEGNPSVYLDNSLAYIQNPDKTDECLLVGGINCQPETAFQQMMETKALFEKRDKRQGYHIIIALPKGEGTPDQVYEIGKRFCEEYLKGEYEAVFAVHTDKMHLHCHIVWNSVNMVTGKKYNSPKGEWKHHIQPITNKLCEEFGLGIMPAEYSKNPVNMSKQEWEEEQRLTDVIMRDAQFCASQAGSMEHFKYLMKRLGYDFKENQYLTVKLPGRKLYHKLEELDDIFAEKSFKYYLEVSSGFMPKFYTKEFNYMRKYSMSSYQKSFYTKMYRLRIVEQKRFYIGSAYYAKELQKFHQLQDEYLYLVKNDIRSVIDLRDMISNNENRMDEISIQQKEIYKLRGTKKRACKSELDVREFQIWNMDAQKQLDNLKKEKGELKRQNVMGQNCLAENLNTAYCEGLDEERVELDSELEVPEYYGAIKDYGSREVLEEAGFDTGRVESAEMQVSADAISKTVDITPVIVDTRTGYHGYESREVDKDVVEKRESNNIEIKSDEKRSTEISYADFISMSASEKASLLELNEVTDLSDVISKLQEFYGTIYYRADFDEIKDTSEQILITVKNEHVEHDALDAVAAIKRYGHDYSILSFAEKALLIPIRIENPNYSLKLHSMILKQLGLKMDMDQMLEDYQGIYEKKLEGDNREKDKQIERGRGR